MVVGIARDENLQSAPTPQAQTRYAQRSVWAADHHLRQRHGDGGRILHHLKARLPDPRTTVLLVGFQAAGTRGRALQDGAQELRIHGWSVPVRAIIETIDGLSAHADRDDILRWLSGFKKPPRETFIVHGEPRQSHALANTLQTRLGWNVRVATEGETVKLS